MYPYVKCLLAPVLAAVAFTAAAADAGYQTQGVVDNLPVFTGRVTARTAHPLAWTADAFPDFDAWRQQARSKILSCLLAKPPVVPWSVSVLGEENRDTHVARKLAFNLTGDSRVLAYITIPKGTGPFPAVLLLHDHGAKFDIGKEKVIRPWGIADEKGESAGKWAEQNYGGRFIGDELARRGYVCFATDALNWSDRGGGGFEGQQKLASNLLHLGMSLAGLMAWEDLRAAEFLAQQPEVDPRRIAAMGWSMGGFRAWQLAALSDHIAAAVAICWMSTVNQLMAPGNNQTKGSSAYNMVHPGLLNFLDFPDIASIACPKPVLFFNGRQDHLFPVAGVEAAYAKMRRVWTAQGKDDQLMTKLWDVPHTFNAVMQDEAFAWLDRVMPGNSPAIPTASLLPGLLGVFFGDANLTRPLGRLAVSRLDDQNPDFPEGNDWSMRLQGRLTPPVSGKIELRVESSHTIRLWLDGRQVMHAESGGGLAEIDARTGVPLSFMLEYGQSTRPAHLRVTWKLPGAAEAAVPASALSHEPSDVEAVDASGVKAIHEILLEVANPEPDKLASLLVWRQADDVFVRASIPSVPDFTCDSWCYEGGMEFEACRDLGGGRLELRHKLSATPEILVVTEITPGGNSVGFLAHLERADGADGPLPDSPATPNLCWQVRPSPAFASNPDPYPSFFARCFIFTERGRTFLDRTKRRRIPSKPTDDPRNNPPWVQIYGPADKPPMRSAPDAWADFSTARFTVPVVGVVSRDGKHLAAIASGSAGTLCQAWHDCMHINSDWSPAGERTWRLIIYAMENSDTKLFDAVERDFPEMGSELAITRAAAAVHPSR